ncbi:TPA: hypothetical protein EYO12_02045 [Candidatus Saccharibacteria bacterium]|nr:hypothetical protein [Candidatus Saccharibacteria bacterium]
MSAEATVTDINEYRNRRLKKEPGVTELVDNLLPDPEAMRGVRYDRILDGLFDQLGRPFEGIQHELLVDDIYQPPKFQLKAAVLETKDDLKRPTTYTEDAKALSEQLIGLVEPLDRESLELCSQAAIVGIASASIARRVLPPSVTGLKSYSRGLWDLAVKEFARREDVPQESAGLLDTIRLNNNDYGAFYGRERLVSGIAQSLTARFMVFNSIPPRQVLSGDYNIGTIVGVLRELRAQETIAKLNRTGVQDRDVGRSLVAALSLTDVELL